MPAARRLLKTDGRVVTLIKPHYEAERAKLRKGVLPIDDMEPVIASVRKDIEQAGFEVLATTQSPILGTEGNVELLAILRPTIDQP